MIFDPKIVDIGAPLVENGCVYSFVVKFDSNHFAIIEFDECLHVYVSITPLTDDIDVNVAMGDSHIKIVENLESWRAGTVSKLQK